MMDAPDLPLWPDPENSSNAAAADRVPTETFAFMPDWLGLGYWLRGRQGYWDPYVTGKIAQQVCNLQALLEVHVFDIYSEGCFIYHHTLPLLCCFVLSACLTFMLQLSFSFASQTPVLWTLLTQMISDSLKYTKASMQQS